MSWSYFCPTGCGDTPQAEGGGGRASPASLAVLFVHARVKKGNPLTLSWCIHFSPSCYVPLRWHTPRGGGGEVYAVANYRPHLSHFWANMSFSRSQLSHFLFLWIDPFFRLNEEHFTFHLQYKHSGAFANRKYEEPSYPNTPIKPKMSDPILVTPLQMRPHYSQSSRENATPSRAQQFPTFEKWETENRHLTQRHTIGVNAITMSVVRW